MKSDRLLERVLLAGEIRREIDELLSMAREHAFLQLDLLPELQEAAAVLEEGLRRKVLH